MRIRFLDSKGNKETLLYNPEIQFFKDGTVVIFPCTAWCNDEEYNVPLYAGEATEVWVDVRKGVYNTTTKDLSEGAFKVITTHKNTLSLVRYKDKINETVKEFLIRKFYEISQWWKQLFN